MKKLLFLLSFLMIFALTTSSFAIQFDVYEYGDAGINQWITSKGGQITVLEDFENITTGWRGELLNTGVGNFTVGEGSFAGTGSSSYLGQTGNTGIKFLVQDASSYWGRSNTTDDGDTWLDSADITELVLSGIDSSLNNLFFYLTDPSDVQATTTVNGVSTTGSLAESFSGLSNGTIWFVGITLEGNESLTSITWSTNGDTNDGYGLDDFSTVSGTQPGPGPVPEPATLMLFGIGLLGLAGAGRRKK